VPHHTFWKIDHHKEPNQIWERKSSAGGPFHELIFARIETPPDMSHISLEYLCRFPAEKYSGIQAGHAATMEYLCRFPAEKYSGIPGWTRRNNLVQLKQRRR
jgi:hypothetical protein